MALMDKIIKGEPGDIAGTGLFNIKKSLIDSAKKSTENNKKLGFHFQSNNLILASINNNVKEFNKLLQMNNKILMSFATQTKRNSLSDNSKKDLFKRKDPNQEIISNLIGIYKIGKETLLWQKKQKKGFGLLEGLGKLLAIGGLIGYLLTGKQEFLNNIWKGFIKYSPVRFLVNLVDSGLTKVVTSAFKSGSKLSTSAIKEAERIGAKGFKSLWKSAGKQTTTLLKDGSKLITRIAEDGTKLTKVVSSTGKILSKGVETVSKGGAKVLLKSLGKSFLKKIPFIGAAMGLIFGIGRIKKGDIIGGALEIISGLTSFIPVVGIPLGLALDAMILTRDLVGKEKFDLGVGKTIKKMIPKIDIRNVPIIGPIIRMIDSFKLFKTDKIKAFNDFASAAFDLAFPGIGLIKTIWDVLNGKNKKETEENTTSTSLTINNSGLKKASGPDLFDLLDTTNTTKNKRKLPINLSLERIKTKAKKIIKKPIGVVKELLAGGKKVAPGLFFKSGVTIKDNRGQAHPAMVKNLYGMAEEYNALTGKNIQINELYRTPEEQNRLNALYVAKYGVEKGNRMAPRFNGTNVHFIGVAMDMQSSNAAELQQLKSIKYPNAPNLLEAWGFWPAGLTFRDKETWHIESEATKKWRESGRTGSKIGETIERGGGNLPVKQNVSLNLPNSTIAPRVNVNESSKIDLSESTIALLSKSIKEAFQSSLPKSINNRINIQTNGRM